MSVLILQIIIKQWDKSQRSPAHVLQRAAVPNQYLLQFPPAVYVLGGRCVIDQHGDDLLGNRVKLPTIVGGMVVFDRLRINLADQNLSYCTDKAGKAPVSVGSIHNQWLQCQYNCRYTVFHADLYYWLYEEVTVNVAWLSEFDGQVFLKSAPVFVYRDMVDFDALGK